MYKITNVSQIDQLINSGTGGAIATEAMSPEMRQALDAYAAGTRAMMDGNHQQAIQTFKKMLLQWPDFVAARTNLANSLNEIGAPNEALLELSKAHQYAPKDPDIHFFAARIYGAYEDREGELREYLKAYEDYPHPHNIDLNYAIGVTYAQLEQYAEAKTWLLRALEAVEVQDGFGKPLGRRHDNERLKVLRVLAIVCEERKEWREAVNYWDQCLALDPGNHKLQTAASEARRNVQGK